MVENELTPNQGKKTATFTNVMVVVNLLCSISLIYHWFVYMHAYNKTERKCENEDWIPCLKKMFKNYLSEGAC
jgi:hypothetical protein